MEREHLIIIALILVALYMMNNDKKQDTVKAIGPMGRIRYTEGGPTLEQLQEAQGIVGGAHIRTREGFYEGDEYLKSGGGPYHIRYSDKNFAQSQHIKNHIRSRNTNSMFSGMTTGSCGGSEGFRFTDDASNCCGSNGNAPGCNGSC
jgi:hypothetical protein